MCRTLSMLICVLLAFVAGGCGEDGPPRYHVSGTVTQNGEPVPVGSIVFQPDPTSGNSGPNGFAKIKNGRFDTREDGRPTSGGAQLVAVEAFDGNVTNPEYAPYGTSIGLGYQERHVLPESEDATLDIELTERSGRGG